MRTWQEALADWRDSPTAEGNAWTSDEALFGLIENVHERLTALETARATAPVSDDEIVEALAEAWATAQSSTDYRQRARNIIQELRTLGYDVVKRS